MFYNLGADGDNHGPTEADKRKKLGFVQVTANAGDCIIMPLRLNHAVMPWLPTDRQRVVLFFTFIPYVVCFCIVSCLRATCRLAVQDSQAQRRAADSSDPLRCAQRTEPFRCVPWEQAVLLLATAADDDYRRGDARARAPSRCRDGGSHLQPRQCVVPARHSSRVFGCFAHAY